MNQPTPFHCRSHASFEAALGAIRCLSRDGQAVVLRDLDLLEPREALALVAFFLHDPEAKGALEPFSALLSAALHRQALSLWDLLPPGDAEAAVTEAFIRDLPLRHPECVHCACFPLCIGYGAWAGSCGMWREVLPRLGAAARELRLLRRA